MAYKYDSALEDKRKLPGVGQYDVSLKPNIVVKRSMFGTSHRQSLGGDPSVPGPGQYEIRPRSSAAIKKETFSKAQRLTNPITSPARTPELKLSECLRYQI